ncbi:uncharacterized protein [Salmo salar]|uniref:TNF family profile domain-containing protein n=1 Tax=Salmo salar TaxID=8030 RepID=A0A1S3QGW4_SALSA|nr:uncharacterized protein LOC106592431 [Salmo salar]|eukprot:XP_014039255.1 PREDICTED: uncharacterized protein LOC106592431 [Salmo salar]
MDVESQKSARPRGRCLDVFLVGSIVLLFLTVATVVVMGTLALVELRSEIGVKPSVVDMQGTSETHHGVPRSMPAYKMQNLAYLQLTSAKLENSTMSWSQVEHGLESSVGDLYKHNLHQHTLQTKQGGFYFLYLDLQLTCTAKCGRGILVVQIASHGDEKLTCQVELPEWSVSNPVTTVTRKCWRVTRLDSQSRLMGRMVVQEAQDTFWKLDVNGSGMGVFLVG